MTITIEDGEGNKVTRTSDEVETWDDYFPEFIICLRGIGFSIDSETEERILDSLETENVE